MCREIWKIPKYKCSQYGVFPHGRCEAAACRSRTRLLDGGFAHEKTGSGHSGSREPKSFVLCAQSSAPNPATWVGRGQSPMQLPDALQKTACPGGSVKH